MSVICDNYKWNEVNSFQDFQIYYELEKGERTCQ